MSRRKQASRRRSYGRRQHELRQHELRQRRQRRRQVGGEWLDRRADNVRGTPGGPPDAPLSEQGGAGA